MSAIGRSAISRSSGGDSVIRSASTIWRDSRSCRSNTSSTVPEYFSRPEVGIGLDVDQLGRDPERGARPAHTALERVADVELAPDAPEVPAGLLELDRRGPGDHGERPDPGEVGDHLLHQAVGEVRVVGIGAQVGERQHHDGLLRRGGAAPPAASGASSAARNSITRREPVRRRPWRAPARWPAAPSAGTPGRSVVSGGTGSSSWRDSTAAMARAR